MKKALLVVAAAAAVLLLVQKYQTDSTFLRPAWGSHSTIY